MMIEQSVVRNCDPHAFVGKCYKSDAAVMISKQSSLIIKPGYFTSMHLPFPLQLLEPIIQQPKT
jgi:hypothetical protein